MDLQFEVGFVVSGQYVVLYVDDVVWVGVVVDQFDYQCGVGVQVVCSGIGFVVQFGDCVQYVCLCGLYY